MHVFTDDAGRQWTLTITVDAIKRVRALIPGVDLLNPDAGDPPTIARLGADPILVCDVVFALIMPQAHVVGVSDEEFGRAMGGDGLANALLAFWEELEDFFRRLDRRDLAAIVATQLQMLRKIVEQNEKKVAAIDLDEILTMTAGPRSTASPASSESILQL